MMPKTPRAKGGSSGADVPSSEEYGTIDLEDADWLDGLANGPEVSGQTSRPLRETSVSVSSWTPFETPLSSQTLRRNSSDLVLSQELEQVAIQQFKGKKRLASEYNAAYVTQKIGRRGGAAVPDSYHEAMISRTSSNTSLSAEYMTPSTNSRTSSVAETAVTSFESKPEDESERTKSAAGADHASNIGPHPMVRSASDPSQKSSQKGTNFDVEAYLNKNLKSRTPFLVLPKEAQGFSFRVCYEVTRVSLHTGVPEKELFAELKHKRITEGHCYGDLWSTFAGLVHRRSRAAGPKGKQSLPERCSDEAWAKAEQFAEHVDLSAELTISKVPNERLFTLKLKPFKLSRSNRTSRKYGSDRLLSIDIPHIEPRELPELLRPFSDQVVKFVINWLLGNQHRFLGRAWAAWFVKPIERTTRRLQKIEAEESLKFGSRLCFFALSGNLDLVPGPSSSARLELKGIEQFLDWALVLDANKQQPIPKLFSRLQLVLSATLQTVEFKPWQIIRRDNAYSDAPGIWQLDVKRSNEKKRNPHQRLSRNGANIMNDGCARMSQKAVKYIVQSLGLDYVPCAFQGRIAGAKGMWMIAANEESLSTFNSGRWHDGNRETDPAVWIELTDEQVKFETTQPGQLYDANPDPSKLGFEVLDYVKPLSTGHLNFQVLSVLLANNVPLNVFEKLLNEDLTDRAEKMKSAMRDPLSLAAFLLKQHPVRAQRVSANGIEMQGGFPFDLVERILYMVNSGFSPLENRLLRQLCLKQINLRNQRLIDKMSVAVGRSTRAFILPDPMNVLEEGECFLYFSSTFEDPRSGEKVVSLHDREVLVARSPVLERSDIQKVRAVFKPELELYKDVVIFPCRGTVPLAQLLSGGDYDGDKVWICWDSDIVSKFKNHSGTIGAKTPAELGIYQRTKSLADHLPRQTDDPVKHISTIHTFLHEGISLNMRQSLLPTVNAYYDKYIYEFGYGAKAQELSSLCAALLDASKAGFHFDRNDWVEFQQRNGLQRGLQKPAYKTQEEQRLKESQNQIDKLVYGARNLVTELKLKFETEFKPEDVSSSDKDLTSLIDGEEKGCKWESGLKAVLDQAKKELKLLSDDWKYTFITFSKKKWSEHGFRTYCDQMRRRFLRIEPVLGKPESITARRWQKETDPKCQLSTRGSWVLLKASALFKMTSTGNCAWWICGQELCRIKAEAKGGSVPVIKRLYGLSAVDTRLVERIKLKERLLETKDADFEDMEPGDSDEEYGAIDWATAEEILGDGNT